MYNIIINYWNRFCYSGNLKHKLSRYIGFLYLLSRILIKNKQIQKITNLLCLIVTNMIQAFQRFLINDIYKRQTHVNVSCTNGTSKTNLSDYRHPQI